MNAVELHARVKAGGVVRMTDEAPWYAIDGEPVRGAVVQHLLDQNLLKFGKIGGSWGYTAGKTLPGPQGTARAKRLVP